MTEVMIDWQWEIWSGRCLCGQSKWPGRPLCWHCWTDLLGESKMVRQLLGDEY